MRRWLVILGVLLALSAIGAAGYLGYRGLEPATDAEAPAPVAVPVTKGSVQQTVTAPGQLVGTQEMLLGMTVNGRLTEINVRPGSVVQAGDVLARIDPRPFEQTLTAARLAWEQAQAKHEQQLAAAELTAENSAARVDSARGRVPLLTAAEVRLQEATDAEARARTEYDKALDRPWEPDDVRTAYRLTWEAAQANRQIAQSEVEMLRNQQWAASQEVVALRTELAQANLNRDYLQTNGVDPTLALAVEQAEKELAATILAAPFDGVVLDVRARVGETTDPHSPFILLADPQQVEVRTTVIEEDLPLIAIGQATELYFDAQPEIAVPGSVARIVPQRVLGEERPLYHVYVTLNDTPPPAVFPGMTADASIMIQQRDEVLRLPRALATAGSDGTAVVEVWQNGRATTREVQTGLRGDVFTEIKDGLQADDMVVAE